MAFDDAKAFIALNPPFGAMAAHEAWGSGRLARAAVFTSRVIDRMPEGATIRAILPDVLRSGTNYRRWREHVEQRLSLERIEAVGQFGPWTDIDVFLLTGTVSERRSKASWWRTAPRPDNGAAVGTVFEVRVGTVVPHRDPKEGDASPYIRAKDLPTTGEYAAGAIRLQHLGRRFKPPFVAVRRTSRPESSRSRVTATVVRGTEPVLAENHLIICRPADETPTSCRRLVKALQTETTSAWLDQRLRCRHLTVTALKDVPLPDWPAPRTDS